MILQRSVTGIALLLLSAAPAVGEQPSPAQKGDASACMSAFASGQQSEESGRLVQASHLFLECAKTSCGEPLWQRCASHNTQLRTTIPSVVPIVTDAAGQPRVDVQVKVDGQLLTSRLDGMALMVDPGTHELSFSAGGTTFATETVTLLRGQRNRLIPVVFRASR
jgi:hypothetical protein